MPSAPIAELRDCASFQLIVHDISSGDINALFVKVNIQNANYARATKPIFDCELNCSWNNWSYIMWRIAYIILQIG